ncbi:BLUF domain-containing protein [Vibrio cholerae RC385]|nr:BLUF domain-containing protein [Vibrio cholerae RC385]
MAYMAFIRLIYVSTVTESLKHSDIELILKHAKKYNFERDITGVLYFNNEYFLQCLEGDREKVNLLYNNIIKDHRHNRVVILDYQEIRNRDFQDWSMGYIPISSITKPLVLKFSSSSNFNPYQLSDSSAYMLLLELKKCLPAM